MKEREEIVRRAKAARNYSDAEHAKDILEADRFFKENGGRVPVELCCLFYFTCMRRRDRPEACKRCSNSDERYWKGLVKGARIIVEE